MKRAFLLLAVGALLIMAAAITGNSVAQVVVETPAVVEVPTVVETPTVVEEPAIISPTYVPIPAPQQEVITPAPATGRVWVGGHWDRTPDSWAWVGGNWVQPPFSNAYWTPGYWQHQGGQFVWENAHWAAANQGVIVNKPMTVPPVYQEVVPAAPVSTVAMAWQPGHWEWRGTWVWIPGAYVQSVVPTATWIPGQWVQGALGWQWAPAHWQG